MAHILSYMRAQSQGKEGYKEGGSCSLGIVGGAQSQGKEGGSCSLGIVGAQSCSLSIVGLGSAAVQLRACAAPNATLAKQGLNLSHAPHPTPTATMPTMPSLTRKTHGWKHRRIATAPSVAVPESSYSPVKDEVM